MQSLDSLPLRTQTQIRIGATSQPRKSTFPPFSSYLSKEGGGRDWDIETHRTDSKYTQNTAMMESTGCRNGFYLPNGGSIQNAAVTQASVKEYMGGGGDLDADTHVRITAK